MERGGRKTFKQGRNALRSTRTFIYPPASLWKRYNITSTVDAVNKSKGLQPDRQISHEVHVQIRQPRYKNATTMEAVSLTD